MSVGAIVGGIVGGIIGWFVGGPMGAVYGISIGFGIGTIVDPITPDIPPPGKPQVGKLSIPTAEEGVAVADVLGTTKILGNILWYANNRTKYVEQQQQEAGKGGFAGMAAEALDVTGPSAPGYHYYLTFAVGLCIGEVDTLYTVYKGDECVWEGELNRPESGGEETITLVDLGSVTFFFGTTDQVAPAVMTNLLVDPTLFTNYRRLCYAFFNDIYLGQYNRLPVYKFVFKKSPVLSFNANKQMETYFYNPAHAVYYILSEMIGLDEAYLNISSFDTVATKLFLEDRGINVTLDRQVPALTYLEIILAHIDGILRWGIDGRLHIKLMRNDENTDNMLVVNEDIMVEDFSFGRKSWLDTQNEIKVQYPLLIVGDCELCLTEDTTAPELDLISQNGSVGSYEITEGCPPFLLYYRLEHQLGESFGWGPWLSARTITGREFNGLASYIGCLFVDTNREMKVVDYFGRDSNSLDINIGSITPLVSGGNPTVDIEDGEVVISWTGGSPPFTLQSFIPLVTFDTQQYSQGKQTGLQSAIVYFMSQTCSGQRILVTDSCNQSVNIYIVIDSHYAIDGGSDLTIGPDETAVVIWGGGQSPFSLQLQGEFEDVWLDVAKTQTIKTSHIPRSITLYAGPEACGTVEMEIIDNCGISIFADIVVSQTCCNIADPFLFDDPSTPDTIVPGGGIDIFVQGGRGLYSWAITDGTGYSLGSPTTSGVSNTLNVVSGTCGVEYTPTVEITVDDTCDGQVVFEIRNTGGTWNAIGSPFTCQTNCQSTSLCTVAESRSHIVGTQRWVAWPVTHGKTGSCNCTRNSNNWANGNNWIGGAGGVTPPISPHTFWSTYHDGTGGCGTCADANDGLDLFRCQYYKWGC